MSDIQPTDQEQIEDLTALEAVLRKVGAWLSENVTTVIYALAAILAIAAVFVFLQRQPAGDVESSTALLTATSPEEYQDIADRVPDSPLGRWSRLRQGDRLLDNAVTNMFTDRKTAVDELEAAKSAYEGLGSQSGLPEELRERVLIGLARVAECECDGTDASVKAVETAWNQVLTEFPESIVKLYAEERLARIAKPEAAEFYQWFASLDPEPLLPGSGSGPVPNIPDGLLENAFPGADALMPEAGEGEGTEDTAGEEEKPASETPDKETADAPPKDDAGDKKATAEEATEEEAAKEVKTEKSAAESQDGSKSTEQPQKENKPEAKPTETAVEGAANSTEAGSPKESAGETGKSDSDE